MAALYGRMRGNRGEVTRMGHHDITSKLETWHGAIRTTLYKDGTFRVEIGSKSSPNEEILTGNVNDGQDFAVTPAGITVVDHRE